MNNKVILAHIQKAIERSSKYLTGTDCYRSLRDSMEALVAALGTEISLESEESSRDIDQE